MTSQEIQSRIEELENRKKELSKQNRANVARFERAKQAVIGGNIESKDAEITDLQQKQNVYQSVVETIENELVSLKEELETVLPKEKRESALKLLFQAAAEAANEAARYEQTRREFNDLCRSYSQKMLENERQIRARRDVFYRAFLELVPNYSKAGFSNSYEPEIENEINAVFDELRARGANLDPIRSRLFSRYSRLLALDSDDFKLSELEFSEIINLAMKIAAR